MYLATLAATPALAGVINVGGINSAGWTVFGIVALVTGIILYISGPTTSKVIGWGVVTLLLFIIIGIAQNGQRLSTEGDGFISLIFG